MRAYVCTGVKKKMAKPMRRERDIYIYMCVAEGETSGEGERRMQGSSVRGSVVAMGIGGEGCSGTGEGRVGRCKRTIKFYGSPELYLSSVRPRLSSSS